MKMTGLLIRVHSPVVELQSSLSRGISRVSSICLVIEITSSRVAKMIEGLGRGLIVFGLLNSIWPTAVMAVNESASANLKATATARSDIDLILSFNLD